MLIPGRMSTTDVEDGVINALIADADEGAAISMTRRDPGNTGPVLLHIDDRTYEVSEDGTTKEIT